MDEKDAEVKLVEAELERLAQELQRFNDRATGKTTPYPAEPPFCSFCGKGKNQVSVLIEGPSAQICDECVVLCQDMVKSEKNSG